MADLDHDKMSAPMRVTGADELHTMEVIEDVDGKKKALVKASIDDGGITISSALRIVEDQSQYNIDTGSWTALYTHNVPSVISGMMTKFNTANGRVRLTIDGNVIFDIECGFLSDMINWNNSSNPNTFVSFNSASNVFYFTPFLPITAASSVLLEGRTTQGNRKVVGQYIQVADL